MKDMREFCKRDLFAQLIGIEYVDSGEGYGKVKMEIKEHHYNGLKVVHGGAIFTIADLAFAVACNSREADAVGINVSISFMNAATTGTLYAEAREISLKKRVCNYDITVLDDKDQLIAKFQGLAYRKV